MKIAVRYYTKTGNTKKLADAVAEQLGLEALTVDVPLSEDVDVLFLCNSVYWAGVDAKVKDFLANPGARIGRIINVSTAGIIESTYKQMKKIAFDYYIPLDTNEFHCRGSFNALHPGNPTADDVKAVKIFAAGVVASLS